MKKKSIIIVIILIVLGVGGFFAFTGNDKEPKFRTEKAVRGSIRAAVTANGTVNAVTTVLVGTQVSGTIKNLYVDYNTPVKKGQLLALIDPATFEAQAAQARANLMAGRANLEKAEAALLDSRRTLERNRTLFSRNLIPRSDLDTAETNHTSAAAQVSAAKAQIEQQKAALRTAEINLKYTRILSPVDGTVISRSVDVGQTVAASFQTPTLFNIAQDLTRMQIDTSVAEADIGRIETDQPVEFTVDAYPERIFKGKVSEIRNAPITVQNVVTYDVVVKVDNPDYKLKPGMTANVSIITAEKADVLKIPNTALRFKMPASEKTAESGKPEVKPASARATGNPKVSRGFGIWILDAQGPKRVRVAVGISDGIFTEVVSGGLKEEQDVIVESLMKPDKKNGSQPRPPRMFR
jgi:HlyD family secretion protein